MSANTPGNKIKNFDIFSNNIKSINKLYQSKLFINNLKILFPYNDILDIQAFLNIQNKETYNKLSILHSFTPPKKKEWTNKLNSLNKKYIQTDFLKTLVRDSELKNKDLSPFWNKTTDELSKKLWVPAIDSLKNFDKNNFSSSIYTNIDNLKYSYFKKTQDFNFQFQHSYPLEDTIKKTYCRKIRFYPTIIQKEYFKQFFGTHRYLYNKTIKYFQNLDKNAKISLTIPFIQPLIMKNNKDMDDNDPEVWLKNIPHDTRKLAIRTAIDAIKSSIELMKKKHIKKFKHKLKNKDDNRQVFHVDHRALKNLRLFPTLLKENSRLIVKNKYNDYYDYMPDHESIILKDGNKYFILFIKEENFNKYEQKNEIISLDPGVKKFQSFYTPDGYCGSFGDKTLKEKVIKIEKKIDKLKSISSNKEIKMSKSKKNYLIKKCYKLKTKVKNIINNFQWKISSFLAKNYKNILLPEFKTQKMQQTLNPYTNRYMNILSHYKFKEKMKYQCEKYGSNLKIVNENYTTKTCGCCGCMNHFVGNSNIFWCPYCKVELERDYQAARNILMKNIQ